MIPERTRLYAGVAAALLVAAASGFGLAKCTPAPLSATEATQKAEAPAAALTMTPQAISAAQIGLQSVNPGGFGAEILAQATVVAAPAGQAVLTARASGAVTRILKRLGDPVRAGETLAVVESREAAQIAADRTTAAAKATLAERNLARERSLFEQRVSPRVDYEQAQAEAAAAAAEARRAQVSAGAAHVTADGRGVAVSSPINGRITASSATLGAFVQPETELFRIADPARVQVQAAVGAADAPRISAGDRAVVELPAGGTLEGRVRSITPALDPETRAATAVLELPAATLQPGQAARVRLFPRVAIASRALVIPEEAVQSIGGRDLVFVRTAQGFQGKPVQVGQRSAGRAEIIGGLSPGQVIATRNAFLLKAELSKSEGEEE